MKKIYLLMFALVALLFTSCQDNEPFITAGEDDYPQILLPWMEYENGEMPEYKNFTRDIEFVDSATVTPALYTTVEWFIDGEKIHEGKKVQKTFIAGTYILKIVATTTKGLSTSRTGKLVVRPCVGDPTFKNNAKNLYLNPVTTKTIEGSNLDGIKAVYINGIAVNNVKCNGESITFDVPQMEEGTYKVVLETEDMQYGCGDVVVSNEPWKDPNIMEISMWEGSHDVTWDSPLKDISQLSKELVASGELKPGTIVKVYVDGNGQGNLTTAWWNNIITGLEGEDNRNDIVFSGSKVLEFELNETSVRMINAQDGLFVVGNGFNVTKVSYIKAVGPKVLWEGSHEVTWGTPLKDIAEDSKKWVADGTLAPGKILKVYVNGEGQGTVATAWWNNFITGIEGEENRGDIMISGTQILVFELTEHLPMITDQDGMFVVGNGYTVTKITVE